MLMTCVKWTQFFRANGFSVRYRCPRRSSLLKGTPERTIMNQRFITPIICTVTK